MQRVLLAFVCLLIAICAGTRSGEFSLPQTGGQTTIRLIDNNLPATSFADVAVADLIAHAAGYNPVTNSVDRSGFPAASLFDAPRNTLLVALKNIPDDDVRDLPFFHGAPATVEPSFSPRDDLSTLTTVLTGVTPSKHGIVQSQWLSAQGQDVVEAYDGEAGSLLVGNLPSIVSQSWGGNSLVAAVAYDPQWASALGPHASLLDAPHHWNNGVLSGRGAAGVLSAPTAAALLKLAEQYASSSGLDMNDAAVRPFLMELSLLAHFTQSLTAAPHLAALRSDSAPDFYAVGVTTLHTLRASHGAASAPYQTALRLLSVALVELRSAVGSDAIVVSLAIVAPTNMPAAQALPLLSHLKLELNLDDASELLPMLYLRPNAYGAEGICTELRQLFSSGVQCDFSQVHIRRVRQDPGTQGADTTNGTNGTGTNGTGNHTEISPGELANFHMILWTVLILVLVLVVGASAIYNMDPTKGNSLLYRTDNQQHAHQS
jgi:hypothetical protein